MRLVREEGRTPFDLAKEFEPSAQSITNWVAQAEIDKGQRPGLTSDEKAELKRLRSENPVLRMEKDLLEKAAAFFAAGNNPTCAQPPRPTFEVARACAADRSFAAR